MTIQILPFLRVGAGAFRDADDAVTPTLKVQQNGAAQAVPILPTLHLRTAGHVVGFDPAVVSRRFPAARAAEVLVTCFPHVELREADLPWRYSPGKPGGQRLDPWLVLVVVERQEGVVLRPASQDLPGTLALRAGLVRELPALADRWAWAHVQTEDDLTKEAPRWPRTLARLIAPRRLLPGRSYVAALVPALRAAVQAGLGQAVTAGPQELAWTAESAELTLPAYDAWQFSTAADAVDFKGLAQRVRGAKEFPASVGRRRVAVDAPGAGLPPRSPGVAVDYRSPLTPRVVADVGDPDAPVVQALAEDLSRALRKDAAPLAGAEDPVVQLPRYGGKTAPAVLQTDVRWRIAAGLGRELVARHQEELVAEVWDQLAEQSAAERRLDRGILAGEVGEALARRLRGLSDLALVQATGRMHGRITGAGGTVRAQLLTELYGGLASPATRRLLRSGGAAGRTLRAARPDRAPLLTFGSSFAGKQAAVLRYSGSAAPVAAATSEVVASAAAAIKAGLQPRARHAERTQARFAAVKPGPTARSRPSPRLQQPLAQWLTALDADLMLPGSADVPEDRVLRIDVEGRFVEALLAGANGALHEELRWRECPVAPGATLLDRFWEGTAGPDVLPLAKWQPKLGANNVGVQAGTTLLIRAALLRLFPDVLIYALDDKGKPVAPTRFGRLAPGTVYVGFPPTLTAKWWLVLEEASDGVRFGLDTAPAKFVGPKPPGNPVDLHWGHLLAPGELATRTYAPAAIPGVSLAGAADVATWFIQRPIRLTLEAALFAPAEARP